MNMFYPIFMMRLIDQEQAMISIKLVSECIKLKVAFADISDGKLFFVFFV